ncbi:PIN domain protein [Asticcacaulis biprosthecium C19]|uniref:PIN domain protein n=1 Tax=Asticcacaulis biprosthecium C19 TaxID=715226 RepID=F4QRV3_9CAUL|nr:type II toxin-antitoxin system VapC family toxin [Asticcacaulis biprosthecium]EGF89473.1 PIN domain protein [Asticcacaulis biprosthecium C19]
MQAIDTNVLVRFLTGDHPEQSQKARAFVGGHDVFVATTVFLESEWVLRSVYDFSTTSICKAFRGFAGLAQVTVENPTLLAQALDRAEAGMDFADALHLGAAAHCDAMVTFDRKFIKAAAGGPFDVIEP